MKPAARDRFRSETVVGRVSVPASDVADPGGSSPRGDRADSLDEAATPSRLRLHLGAGAVLLVGFIITAALSLGTRAVHDTNEDRLLGQRVQEAAAVVTAAVPSLQTPLASAAVLAQATNGNTASFSEFMTPLVKSGVPFISASVWPTTSAASPRPIVVVGARPELESQTGPAIQRFFQQTTGRGTLTINDLLSAPVRRLGYAYSVPGPKARFLVYAEADLPRDRRATIDKDSAFSDLNYALYLGTAPVQRDLLASSAGGAILRGRHASAKVPFANTKLLIVMSARTELGGSLLARLPWAFGGFGLLLTLAAASLVERLLRRREHAESLAHENASLYAEQRSVAQTLQHSLLPASLPQVEGLTLATRYVAGVKGIDIGGDWYDVVSLDNGQVLFVVGDVSGRGLRAATTMAELRYAIRAYAAQGDPPAAILTKISRLIDVGRDGQFATVLCGTIDVPAHRVVLANAGHPDLLVIAANEAWYAASSVGVPVGVAGRKPYAEVTVTVPPNATLLAYTDGLIERRGEKLDVGLERLRNASLHDRGTIEDLLANVLAQTRQTEAADDTAILGLRWDN